MPAGAEQARLALPAMTSERRGSVFSLSAPARERLACVAVASALIVAGGLVAAVDGAAPFAHGSWLAAYLVLVGGVAQLHPTRLAGQPGAERHQLAGRARAYRNASLSRFPVALSRFPDDTGHD